MNSKIRCWFGTALVAFGVSAFGQGELFKVDFDNYNVTAEFAKGDPKSISFSNQDLQLRMFPGAGNGKKNGLCLENTEYLSYNANGNLNTKQGTISLWVSPQNWKISDNGPQVFFTGEYWGADRNFSMILYKNTDHKITFYYGFKTPESSRQRNLVANASVEEKKWHKNSWHKIDALWDHTGMKLYIDGQFAAERKFNPNEGIELPDIPQGRFMLGTNLNGKQWIPGD